MPLVSALMCLQAQTSADLGQHVTAKYVNVYYIWPCGGGEPSECSLQYLSSPEVMPAEKGKLQGELPIVITPSNPAARDRAFTNRVAASCIAITIGFVWLASHTSRGGLRYELYSGHGEDHGPLRGKKAEDVFL
jgi:hypothetical protein